VLFDWFTVAAQIINFLILVVLLKRFLYAPIIRVMNEREQNIAAKLEHARITKEEADREMETYRQKMDELHQNRQQLFDKAQSEVETWRLENIEKARVDVDEAQQRWRQALQQQQEAFISELRHRSTDQVLVLARKALADLANADLEKQIVAIFIERVQDLDEENITRLKEAAKNSEKELVVSSAFELDPEMQETMKIAIAEKMNGADEVAFEVSPETICGIELKASDYVVSWSLKSYLDSLAERISDLFEEPVTEV
jgi:F-type H+-transporting ATPase subunit b